MYMSPFMRSLLEAPQDNNRNRNQNNPDEEGEQQQNAENQEDTQVEDNTEDQTDQDNQEENHDDNTEDNPDDNDPFNDDPEGGDNQEDLSNPPDGLESPDATEDDSEDMTDAGEEDEQNIQLNILPLSKLDRLTLKQKCYANFKDLRVKINRVISSRCPISPKPVTSVQACTLYLTMMSLAALLSVVITLRTYFSPSSEAIPAFAAVVIMPEPSGLVNMSSSPGFAPLLVIILSGWTNPVTAMPYFGSSSSMEWPPVISAPASYTFS